MAVRYLALLRGINVGGNNIIPMADLRACFTKAGFTDVVTYIQSGNVIFCSGLKDQESVCKKIEAALSKAFDYDAKVVVISEAQLKKAVKEAPEGFGSEPEKYRYDVMFLRPPLTPSAAVKDIPGKPGVDAVSHGSEAVYFSRLIAKAAQSHLPRLIKLPIYKQMTIRNWNTTTKLLAMMSGQ
jgi:uncharacterized protein (DUF1697 family)